MIKYKFLNKKIKILLGDSNFQILHQFILLQEQKSNLIHNII